MGETRRHWLQLCSSQKSLLSGSECPAFCTTFIFPSCAHPLQPQRCPVLALPRAHVERENPSYCSTNRQGQGLQPRHCFLFPISPRHQLYTVQPIYSRPQRHTPAQRQRQDRDQPRRRLMHFQTIYMAKPDFNIIDRITTPHKETRIRKL